MVTETWRHWVLVTFKVCGTTWPTRWELWTMDLEGDPWSTQKNLDPWEVAIWALIQLLWCNTSDCCKNCGFLPSSPSKTHLAAWLEIRSGHLMWDSWATLGMVASEIWTSGTHCPIYSNIPMPEWRVGCYQQLFGSVGLGKWSDGESDPIVWIFSLGRLCKPGLIMD